MLPSSALESCIAVLMADRVGSPAASSGQIERGRTREHKPVLGAAGSESIHEAAAAIAHSHLENQYPSASSGCVPASYPTNQSS